MCRRCPLASASVGHLSTCLTNSTRTSEGFEGQFGDVPRMVAASIAKWQTGHKMLIGLMAAALACVGYGTASVLQAYGARSSEVVASGNRQRSEVTATGAPTLRSTIHAALTPTFVAGMVLGHGRFGAWVRR